MISFIHENVFNNTPKLQELRTSGLFDCCTAYRMTSGHLKNCNYKAPPYKACDIDECTLNHPCHANATCDNTVGSFICTCDTGFSGDDFNCTDIDECTLNHPCHANATCNNTVGSFICTCDPGFSGDDFNCTAHCQAETTGDNRTQGIFLWKTVVGNESDVIDTCPYGSQPGSDYEFKPSRYCRCDDKECRKATWDKPSTDICNNKSPKSKTARKLANLQQSLLNGKTTPVNASEKLVKLTSNTTEFRPDELALTISILENIVNSTAVLNETGPSIVKTVNNILNIEANVTQKNNQSSNRISAVISKYLENVPIKRGRNVSQNEENIAVYAQDWNAKNFQGVRVASLEDLTNKKNIFKVDKLTDFSQPNTQVSLTLPKTLLQDIKPATEQRLSFVVYRKTTLFQYKGRNSPYSNAQTVKKLNSFIISASVKGQDVKNLAESVQSVYHPLDKGIAESAECVFWDVKLKNGQGDWFGDGCLKGTDNGLVTCHCNHLTNFAILMDVYIDDHNESVLDKALSIISYIGCAVSLFGLVLTIITFLSFKNLRSKAPIQILLNFCIALSLTLVVFLTAAERSKTSSMVACRAAAVALHYLVLVVFMWMAIQAINMFLLFVIVIHQHSPRFVIKCCMAGWGLPAIIVMITAATSIDNYGDEYFCRVKGFPFWVAFLAPVLVILLGNSIAFVLIFRSLLVSGTKVTAIRRISGLQQAKRAAAILVVLGATWLFGILAIGEAKFLFQSLFCIFNSLQGLLVFIFYCVLSSETRARYASVLRGKHPTGLTTPGPGLDTRRRVSRLGVGQGGTASMFNTKATSSSASVNVVGNNFELKTVTTNQYNDS